MASTSRTILDFYIVNVEGMWVLYLVYIIHLALGIVDSTGIEVQQQSFSNACKIKNFIKSCLPLFKMD